jgi:hypothetical protein
LVELNTFPPSSTATHNVTDGHDTPVNAGPFMGCIGLLVVSTCLTRHAADPPVGSVELSTFPAWSTATQNETDGQEIAIGSVAETTRAWRQLPAPALGSVEDSAPAKSTATHSDTDGQETPVGESAPRTRTAVQLVGTAGVELMRRYPSESNATHNDTDGARNRRYPG